MSLKVLHLKCHVGLGDAFVMQGMVHHYLMSGRYSRIVLDTRRSYEKDMRLLYHHVQSSIEYQHHENYETVPEDWPVADEVVSFGLFSGDKAFHVPTWDREFYRQAGIPFIKRWQNCYVPRSGRSVKRRDFTIRHHDPQRGFLIEGLKPDMDILPSEDKPLLEWVPELSAAKEIHCIDSCVMNLVESMWHLQMIRRDAKLFYHEYAREDPPATVLAPWRVLK